MSLRSFLLHGKSPKEEALIDTVLVLYESYRRAGRGDQEIVIMVTRDFKFHLSHLGVAVVQHPGNGSNANSYSGGPMPMPGINAQETPASMCAEMQTFGAQAQGAVPLKELGPLLAAQAPMHAITHPSRNSSGNYNHEISHTAQQRSHHPANAPMMGFASASMNNANHQSQRNQPNLPLAKQNSLISIDDTDDASR